MDAQQSNSNYDWGLRVLDYSDYIALNRKLIRVLGLCNAVLLCELISEARYWLDRGMLDEGWFFSTVDNLHERCGLSKHQQSNALSFLADNGFVEYKAKGMPRKRYVRVNVVKVFEVLNQPNDQSSSFHSPLHGPPFAPIGSTNGPDLDGNKPNIRSTTTDSLSGYVDYQPSSSSEYNLQVSSGFVPPTVEEVKDFFATNMLDQSDAEDFWLHYQSQGWVRGNNIPVSDWHALAVSWNKRQKLDRASDRKPKSSYDMSEFSIEHWERG